MEIGSPTHQLVNFFPHRRGCNFAGASPWIINGSALIASQWCHINNLYELEFKWTHAQNILTYNSGSNWARKMTKYILESLGGAPAVTTYNSGTWTWGTYQNFNCCEIMLFYSWFPFLERLPSWILAVLPSFKKCSPSIVPLCNVISQSLHT